MVATTSAAVNEFVNDPAGTEARQFRTMERREGLRQQAYYNKGGGTI